MTAVRRNHYVNDLWVVRSVNDCFPSESFSVKPRLVLVSTVQFVASLHFVAQELRKEENGGFEVQYYVNV